MSYVVLQPNSNSNPSDKYRVCEYGAWVEYVNGHVQDFDAFEFENSQDAYAKCTEMNRAVS